MQQSRPFRRGLVAMPLAAAAWVLVAAAAADPLNCGLAAYTAAPGLTASVAIQALAPGVVAGQPAKNPGLSRLPWEIVRATATYRTDGCTVTTNGARLQIAFPRPRTASTSGRWHRTAPSSNR
jgi:hypothetical protein